MEVKLLLYRENVLFEKYLDARDVFLFCAKSCVDILQ